MSKLKLTALVLALIMLVSVFVSCAKDGDVLDTDTDTQATDKADKNKNDEDPNAVEITVADAKGSAGLVGDFKAAFAKETAGENVITGAAQNSVPYSIWAAFSAPTKVTSISLTAPSKDMKHLANATIDASVDGVNWTELKPLGSSITKDKVYNLSIKDTTEYLYIRVRQSDKHRAEEFRFRSMVIKGVPAAGAGGDLSVIQEEVDPSTLVAMNEVLGSNAGTGVQANVFLDNDQSWTADVQGLGSPNFIIGTMTKKTEIRTITVKTLAGNESMAGAKIQASTDGQTWVDLYTIEELGEAEGKAWTWHVNDATEYSYVRVLQPENATTAFQLDSILIYGVESETATERIPEKYIAATSLKVVHSAAHTHVEPNSKDEIDVSNVWDLNDKSTKWTNKAEGEGADAVLYYIGGSFENKTVITQINYYCPPSNGNRVRTSYFEASVDGETWVKIATLPGTNDLYSAGAVLTFNVDDDTKYNYIKLVQGEGFYQWHWSIGTIEIVGVQYDEDDNLIQNAGSSGPVVDLSQATTVAPTYVSSTTKHSGNEADVWDTTDTTTITQYKDSSMPNHTMAKFDYLTVITKIKYYAPTTQYVNRARESYFEASVDGDTWVRIATLPESVASGETYEVSVGNITAFKYIRMVQKTRDQAEYWTIGTVEIIGVATTETGETDTPAGGDNGDSGDNSGQQSGGTTTPTIDVSAAAAVVPTYVSDTGKFSGAEPATVWDTSDKTTFVNFDGSKAHNVVAKFDKLTYVTKIIYYSHYDNGNNDPDSRANRARTSYFEGSVDGVTWVKIATLPEAITASNTYTLDVDEENYIAFKYIRICRNVNANGYWSIGVVEVIGVETETVGDDPLSQPAGGDNGGEVEGETVAVTYLASLEKAEGGDYFNNSTNSSRSDVWDTTDKTTYTLYNNGATEYMWVSGTLATATKITQIKYYASTNTHMNRARGSFFEASVDGVTWVKIATLPDNLTSGETYELDVTDTTEYNYIRMVQQNNSGFLGQYWTIGTVEVIGVASSANA